MNWQLVFGIVGGLLVVEGAALLLIKKESWAYFVARISELSVGQVHTIGAVLLASGAIILFFAL